MTTDLKMKPDYRTPTASKWAAPRAVADGEEAQSSLLRS
jgi:hypothetical protein